MELSRNHWFAVGVILLALGVQLRFIETFVLNEKCSDFVAENIKKEDPATANPFTSLLSVGMPTAPREEVITPPKWIGWALLSIGAVVTLQTFAMRKP